MDYKEIARLASNVDARDLAVYGWSKGKYAIARKPNSSVPISLSVEITYWCNRRCAGCYIPDALKTKNPVMDEDFLRQIVGQAKKAGIPFIGFVGGEPLSPIARDGVYHTAEKNPLTPFFTYTNGDFIKNISARIRGHHNIAYMISLDGLQKNHDDIRGRGSFERVTGAFKELRDAKKIYGASVTARKFSQNEIASAAFFDYLGRSEIKFVRIRTVKSLKEEISQSETEAIIEKTEGLAKKYSIILSWGGLEDAHYEIPRDLMVAIDGTVRATRFDMHESFGNLHQKPLERIIADINIIVKDERRHK